MKWLQLQFLVITLLLLGGLRLTAQQPIPQPTAAEPVSADNQRDSIHLELDQNEQAVSGLYQLLDATPQAEAAARRFVEAQIEQFDDRSEILFKQLDTLDRREFEQTRRHDLQLQANRLEEEAKQLRRSGHVLPATLREAKAKSIRKSLGDGTWKLLVAEEWDCQDDSVETQRLELLTEVRKLKSETVALRQEVRLLRELVAQLSSQMHPLKQTEQRPEKTVRSRVAGQGN